MALRLLFITSLLTAALLAATSCGGGAGQQASNSSRNTASTSGASTTEDTSVAPEESTAVPESSTTQAGKQAEKGNGKTQAAGRSGGNKIKTVKMISLKYVPATVHVAAGTTIRWVPPSSGRAAPMSILSRSRAASTTIARCIPL